MEPSNDIAYSDGALHKLYDLARYAAGYRVKRVLIRHSGTVKAEHQAFFKNFVAKNFYQHCCDALRDKLPAQFLIFLQRFDGLTFPMVPVFNVIKRIISIAATIMTTTTTCFYSAVVMPFIKTYRIVLCRLSL